MRYIFSWKIVSAFIFFKKVLKVIQNDLQIIALSDEAEMNATEIKDIHFLLKNKECRLTDVLYFQIYASIFSQKDKQSRKDMMF